MEVFRAVKGIRKDGAEPGDDPPETLFTQPILEGIPMPMHRRSLLLALAAGSAVPLLQACGGGDDDHVESPGTIVAIASGDSRFSVLVEAVVAADLVDTLNSAGPFTVFAPTNDAFVALLGELGLSKEALLANKALLTSVLTYHVVSGALRASDIAALQKPATVTTVQGATFSVDANLDITDARGRKAKLLITDLIASNGVIHAIDTVILPPA
jgi:uncharacterized surface protein with fasciclin (FAS1) repeats